MPSFYFPRSKTVLDVRISPLYAVSCSLNCALSCQVNSHLQSAATIPYALAPASKHRHSTCRLGENAYMRPSGSVLGYPHLCAVTEYQACRGSYIPSPIYAHIHHNGARFLSRSQNVLLLTFIFRAGNKCHGQVGGAT